MIIERIKSIVVTTYDGENLHILDVRQNYNRLLRLIYIYENNYQVDVALFKSVI